ncbi:MAG: ABC transporter permease [Chloroflexi bacterium]|nr:ABC transporter permease [Chloroflexota bacterium]
MKRIGDSLRRALVPALALITAFLLGAIVIVLTDFEHLQHIGTDPGRAIGDAIGGVVDGYGAMLSSAIGDPRRIVAAIQSGDARDIAAAIWPLTEALVSATPLIFVSLGVLISFRAGLFNLGAGGQLLMGGLGATITANSLDGHLPSFLILIMALVGGTLSGAAYGFLPGFLKARTGAHEVITTLMLNSIAPEITILALSSGAFSRSLTPIADIPLIIDLPTIRLDWGFVVAVLMAAVVSVLLFRTTIGFELRTVGFSRTAARSAGMSPGMTVTLAMTLSGGLAAMGGAFLSLGPVGGLAQPYGDIGFVALALALIAGLRPSGVVLAALLYGALTNGAKNMAIVTGIPLAFLVVIVAFAMMFVAAPGLIRSIWRLNAAKPTTGFGQNQPLGPADST